MNRVHKQKQLDKRVVFLQLQLSLVNQTITRLETLPEDKNINLRLAAAVNRQSRLESDLFRLQQSAIPA